MEKEYIRADDLFRASFALAKSILDSGCRPAVLLAVWRGGTPIGIVVHEFLRYKGIETYHAVIKAESSGWIVFPHELCGLSDEEIRTKDPDLHRLVSDETAGEAG